MELILIILLIASVLVNIAQRVNYKRLKDRHEMIMEVKDSAEFRLSRLQAEYDKIKPA